MIDNQPKLDINYLNQVLDNATKDKNKKYLNLYVGRIESNNRKETKLCEIFDQLTKAILESESQLSKSDIANLENLKSTGSQIYSRYQNASKGFKHVFLKKLSSFAPEFLKKIFPSIFVNNVAEQEMRTNASFLNYQDCILDKIEQLNEEYSSSDSSFSSEEKSSSSSDEEYSSSDSDSSFSSEKKSSSSSDSEPDFKNNLVSDPIKKNQEDYLSSSEDDKDVFLDPPTPIISDSNELQKALKQSKTLTHADESSFDQLEQITDTMLKYKLKKMTNTGQCRFSGNVHCHEETAVKIPNYNDKVYLHANHVKLEGIHFIITQYPYPHQIPLFWMTCMQEQVGLIVDLTNPSDESRYSFTLYANFNDDELIKIFDKLPTDEKFFIEQSSSDDTQLNSDGLISYVYHLSKKIQGKESSSKVPRLHYRKWPDKQAIPTNNLDVLLAGIDKKRSAQLSQPLMIHCTAGVGRSGTIAVSYALKKLIEENKIEKSKEALANKIIELILRGREQRGSQFVQTSEQFALIYNWGLIKLGLA